MPLFQVPGESLFAPWKNWASHRVGAFIFSGSIHPFGWRSHQADIHWKSTNDVLLCLIKHMRFFVWIGDPTAIITSITWWPPGEMAGLGHLNGSGASFRGSLRCRFRCDDGCSHATRQALRGQALRCHHTRQCGQDGKEKGGNGWKWGFQSHGGTTKFSNITQLEYWNPGCFTPRWFLGGSPNGSI